MLSPRLLALIREYWKVARPTEWLFPGGIPGRPITVGSVHRICVQVAHAAGLGKHVTIHTLRNATAYYTTFRRMAYFQGNSCCPGVGFSQLVAFVDSLHRRLNAPSFLTAKVRRSSADSAGCQDSFPTAGPHRSDYHGREHEQQDCSL